MINFERAIDRIGAILAGCDSPEFTRVFAGEPLALPPDGVFACYWYVGDGEPPEGHQTLTGRMHIERFRVQVYWPRRPEPMTLRDQEIQIGTCKQALLAAFAGDSQLNGDGGAAACEDLDITAAEAGFMQHGLPQGPVWWRVLRFDLELRGLNEEGIDG